MGITLGSGPVMVRLAANAYYRKIMEIDPQLDKLRIFAKNISFSIPSPQKAKVKKMEDGMP